MFLKKQISVMVGVLLLFSISPACAQTVPANNLSSAEKQMLAVFLREFQQATVSGNFQSLMFSRPAKGELFSPSECLREMKLDRQLLAKAQLARAKVVFRKIQLGFLGEGKELQTSFLVLHFRTPSTKEVTVRCVYIGGKEHSRVVKPPLQLVLVPANGRYKLLLYLNFSKRNRFGFADDGYWIEFNFVKD